LECCRCNNMHSTRNSAAAAACLPPHPAPPPAHSPLASTCRQTLQAGTGLNDAKLIACTVSCTASARRQRDIGMGGVECSCGGREHARERCRVEQQMLLRPMRHRHSLQLWHATSDSRRHVVGTPPAAAAARTPAAAAAHCTAAGAPLRGGGGGHMAHGDALCSCRRGQDQRET